jgi:hypothetical protein
MTSQWVLDGRKPCSKCGRSLPVEDFPRNGQVSTGLSSWCRRCHAGAVKAWREKQQETA